MVPDSVAPLRFAPERSAPVRSVSLKSAPLSSALARRAPSKSRYARSMPLRFWPPKSSFSGLPSTARSRSTSVLVKGGTDPPASGLPIFMIMLPRHSRSPSIFAMSMKLSRNSIPHIISAACHLSYRNCRRFLLTPADQKRTEFLKIAQAAQKGITALISDCLGADRPGFTPSEEMLTQNFEKTMGESKGKVVITTNASNVSRLNQAIEPVATRRCDILDVHVFPERIDKQAFSE